MDMLQSQKVVPEDLSSPSSRKYRVSDQDRTASGKVLQRKDSFSTLGASEETIYKQLSAVYLDPVFLRYADAGAEKDIKDGQAQAANPYVKKMEHSFAIINAQRYGLFNKLRFMSLLILNFRKWIQVPRTGAKGQCAHGVRNSIICIGRFQSHSERG